MKPQQPIISIMSRWSQGLVMVMLFAFLALQASVTFSCPAAFGKESPSLRQLPKPSSALAAPLPNHDGHGCLFDGRGKSRRHDLSSSHRSPDKKLSEMNPRLFLLGLIVDHLITLRSLGGRALFSWQDLPFYTHFDAIRTVVLLV